MGFEKFCTHNRNFFDVLFGYRTLCSTCQDKYAKQKVEEKLNETCFIHNKRFGTYEGLKIKCSNCWVEEVTEIFKSSLENVR